MGNYNNETKRYTNVLQALSYLKANIFSAALLKGFNLSRLAKVCLLSSLVLSLRPLEWDSFRKSITFTQAHWELELDLITTEIRCTDVSFFSWSWRTWLMFCSKRTARVMNFWQQQMTIERSASSTKNSNWSEFAKNQD